MRATPERSTNILNGIGGGSSDGMMTASTPYFSMNVLARVAPFDAEALLEDRLPALAADHEQDQRADDRAGGGGAA